MIRQGGGGKTIGAASVAPHEGFAVSGHYSASKRAVRGLTQALPGFLEHGYPPKPITTIPTPV